MAAESLPSWCLKTAFVFPDGTGEGLALRSMTARDQRSFLSDQVVLSCRPLPGGDVVVDKVFVRKQDVADLSPLKDTLARRVLGVPSLRGALLKRTSVPEEDAYLAFQLLPLPLFAA